MNIELIIRLGGFLTFNSNWEILRGTEALRIPGIDRVIIDRVELTVQDYVIDLNTNAIETKVDAKHMAGYPKKHKQSNEMCRSSEYGKLEAENVGLKRELEEMKARLQKVKKTLASWISCEYVFLFICVLQASLYNITSLWVQ